MNISNRRGHGWVPWGTPDNNFEYKYNIEYYL